MITRQIWGKNEMSWKRPLNCHLRRCNNLLKPRRKLVKIANSGSTLLHLVPSCSRLIALTTKRRNIKRRRMQRVNNGHCRRSVRCNLCSRMFHGRISLTSHQIHHYKWSNACLIVTQNSSRPCICCTSNHVGGEIILKRHQQDDTSKLQFVSSIIFSSVWECGKVHYATEQYFINNMCWALLAT